MTDVQFRFRKGAGSNLDVLFGTVTLKPTLAHSRGTSMVLPAPSTWDIINGEVLATNVQPTPEPEDGVLEWGYEVTVKDRHGKTYSFLVGVPDSTSTVEFVSLPRYFETKPPLFGQGPKGDTGEAATIQVGTVTSGAEASVTNSGTSNDAKLDFVLPKGDKGDRGDGVPAGGTALQYLRKDSSGATTEWATVDKTTLGLSQVDNTSDANKPVSVAQGQAIEKYGKLGNGAKHPDDPPTSYSTAYSTVLGRVSDGWPQIGNSTTYTQITTMRSGNNYGGVVQLLSAHSDSVAPLKYRVSKENDSWGEFKTLSVVEGSKITFGNGALSSLPSSYGMTVNSTVVSLGYQSHKNMTEVRQSIAIGSNAMSQGTKSRDNIAIGDDAGWATESLHATYVQAERDGTRNVMIGGAAGRANKRGIGHVLIGRGAGASIVSGNGAVVVGSNANTGAQPIGLSGEIENWGSYFEGPAESRPGLVSIGCEASWSNSGKDITAVGDRALFSNTKGQGNTGIGRSTLEKLGSNTWINGGEIKYSSTINASYKHYWNDLTLTVESHTAAVGDVISLRLLTGASATFLGDKAYAEVTSTTPTSITVTHPVSSGSEVTGDAAIYQIIGKSTSTSTSNNNSSLGAYSLRSLVTGAGNSALGYDAGRDLTSGNDNTYVGNASGRSLRQGGRNLFLGYLSGAYLVDGSEMTQADNVVCVGSYTRVSGNNQLQLGSSALTVYAQSAIQTRSDARDKAEVRDTKLGLEFINKLRPVDFKWDYRDDYMSVNSEGNLEHEDKTGDKKRSRYHHGLIAQEVSEVIKETGIDFGGYQDHKINGGSDVLTIGYEELIAPLIKAVQELSEEVKELKKQIN